VYLSRVDARESSQMTSRPIPLNLFPSRPRHPHIPKPGKRWPISLPSPTIWVEIPSFLRSQCIPSRTTYYPSIKSIIYDPSASYFDPLPRKCQLRTTTCGSAIPKYCLAIQISSKSQSKPFSQPAPLYPSTNHQIDWGHENT
jgi:hypothetical protein